MNMVKKSITITEQQGAWMQTQMDVGNYGTDSEIIREALREKQERSVEIDIIRARLIEAENTGFTDTTLDDIWIEARENG